MIRRILLLAVAALLSASALLAVGILLVGDLGETEGRILATAALLAGYGLVALPSTVLLDDGRETRLASAGIALAAAGAALAVTSVWADGDSDPLGKALGTATLVAVAFAQTAALSVRRRPTDPTTVRQLFVASILLAVTAATFATVLLWTEPASGAYVRVLGALVVLDLLSVALQPVLARVRAVGSSQRVRVLLAEGRSFALDVEAPDRASAAAQAIRAAERVDGGAVVGLAFEDERTRADATRAGRARADVRRSASGSAPAPRP